MATRAGAPTRCPICRGKLPEEEESPERGPKFAPLCSLRCKRIDLATWLGEGYRIADPSGPQSGPDTIVSARLAGHSGRIAGEPAEPEDEQSGDER